MPRHAGRRRSSRATFERHVAEVAKLYSWRHHRGGATLTLDGYTDGFPQHVLLRGRRLLFLTIDDDLLPAEARWIDELAAAVVVEPRLVTVTDLSSVTELLRSPASRTTAGPPNRVASRDGNPATASLHPSPNRQEEE